MQLVRSHLDCEHVSLAMPRRPLSLVNQSKDQPFASVDDPQSATIIPNQLNRR